MGWMGTLITVGSHMRPAVLFLQVGVPNGVVHVLLVCQVRGCLDSYIGVLGSSPAEDITPDGDAGSQGPLRGYNILDYALGCSYFANIPHMEEISDQCS